MSDEQLQFAISQYVDGTLPPAEVAALEKRLREDPEARRLLEEYRRIGDLVQIALPEPQMDWDKLTRQISSAIDRDAVPMGEAAAPAPATYRIGFWKPLAMAAAVLVCATVAVVLMRGKGEPQNPTQVQVAVNPAPVTPTPAPAPSMQTPANPQPSINTTLARSDIKVLIPDEKPAGSSALSIQISGPANTAVFYDDAPSSVSIAGDPSRMAMSDDFGMVQ